MREMTFVTPGFQGGRNFSVQHPVIRGVGFSGASSFKAVLLGENRGELFPLANWESIEGSRAAVAAEGPAWPRR